MEDNQNNNVKNEIEKKTFLSKIQTQFPLKSINEPHHPLRVTIYIMLLFICSLYILYLFFIDDTDIIENTKYYNRSDLILNLDESHKLALKEFIYETNKEIEESKSKKKKIKEKLLNILPFLGITSLLRFDNYRDGVDTILTSFIGITSVLILGEILPI
jgi:hypothetical protein